MTPTTETNETPSVVFDEKRQIKSTEKVFDLEARDFVEIVKVADKRSVENMEQFVALMGNDAAAILKIINDGLESYDQKQLAKRNDVPVYTESEDGGLEPYAGSTLGEAATAKLKATQLALAKNLFGYAKSLTPEKKKAAKESALQFVLSNPAAIEMLKAQ